MARRAKGSSIKRHRIYTVWEAAEALGVHRQTAIRWIKDKGLVADQSTRPWLIRGDDLKNFLGARRARTRQRLALHHHYCLGCKQPQEPAGRIADYAQQTATTGMLKALCPTCGSLMHKVVRRADLEAIRAKLEVTVQQANPRLVSQTGTRSNVTFEGEAQTHDKAHLRKPAHKA